MSAPLERPETLMVVMCLLEPRLRLDDQVGGAERDEAVRLDAYLFTGVSFEGNLSARGAPWWSDARQDAGSQGAEALPTCTSTSPEQHTPGRRACTCSGAADVPTPKAARATFH